MRVEIYSKTGCYHCNEAKKIFEQSGVQYKEILVGSDMTREQFFEKFPGKNTVPQIMVDGTLVGGHEDLLEWMKSNDLSLLNE